ncbi:hypothetical protein WJX81_005016 [Elliptochloris bilobata]|uniref:Uncharacterized protein n=1 Tax=Elliptochloris bilobata TaxID=381761 RepID=A0AAW1R198_9CHLO
MDAAKELRLSDSGSEGAGLLPAAWRFECIQALRLDRSANEGEADSAPSSSTPTSAAALEECVCAHLGALEAKLEALLQHVSDELATEVGREQNHLILMQDQVDKMGQTLLRELGDVGKRLQQEKTQRCFVQGSVRECREELASVHAVLAQQAAELRGLRARLAEMEAPWLWRLARAIFRRSLQLPRVACGGPDDSATRRSSSDGEERKPLQPASGTQRSSGQV